MKLRIASFPAKMEISLQLLNLYVFSFTSVFNVLTVQYICLQSAMHNEADGYAQLTQRCQ